MHYKFIAPSAVNYEEIIPPFSELIRRIEVQDYRLKMLSASVRIPKKVKKGGILQPVLPLIPERLPTAKEDKTKLISFDLKMQVGQSDTATKYKKAVRKFEEGTAQQWIDVLKDMIEIWTQNGVKEGSDRAATVRSVVKGESATAFESALQEQRMGEDGVELPLTTDHVDKALKGRRSKCFSTSCLRNPKTMDEPVYVQASGTNYKADCSSNK